MNMDIKITVIDHFTRETIIDSIATGITSTWEVVEQNHQVFRGAYPDCYVNFVCEETNSYICSQPYNQSQDERDYDEGRMTWEQYCDKWYNGALSGCNEDDMSDDEIERQIDEIRKAEFNQMDSICY